MSTLTQDLCFVGRLARRTPGFYVLVIVTLGLGIGANLAIFTVANRVLLSPLPYSEPQRLVVIWESNLEEGKDRERVAPPNFEDYLEVFDGAAAWWAFHVNLTDATGADPLRISTVECTANLFSVQGITPILGPGFVGIEELFSPELTVVISHRLWQNRYRGDPKIIGQTVTSTVTPTSSPASWPRHSVSHPPASTSGNAKAGNSHAVPGTLTSWRP